MPAVDPNRPIGRPPSPTATAARRAVAPRGLAPDRLLTGSAPTAPTKGKAGVGAPGEDLRNRVSVVNMLLGPLVTAGQGLDMLARMTFSNPVVDWATHTAVDLAQRVGHMPFLRTPLARSGFQTTARVLPFISAGLLSFDAYAAWHTVHDEKASGLRKGLTVARFVANAAACAMTFVPGAGFVYALVPSLIGNVFEFAIWRMNVKQVR